MTSAFLFLAAAVATPVAAAPLPPDVRAVVEAAIASGDVAAINAVVRFTVAAHPDAQAEVRALHRTFLDARAAETERQEAERLEKLAASGPLDNWDGQVELGAVRATGSGDHLGLFAALNGQRTGIDWTHRLEARAELQESQGVRTVERIGASWKPRRRFGERLYGYGLAQYERDPFVGFDGRYTAALGAGYRLVQGRDLRLELEGGPSFRSIDSTTGQDYSSLGGRASLDFAWKVAPTVEIKQSGTLTVEELNGSGRATTSLDSRLLGPLRMRLSYELRYEEDVLRSIEKLDTTSRATLVVDF
jgi:putative salt-induced outer membrane protein